MKHFSLLLVAALVGAFPASAADEDAALPASVISILGAGTFEQKPEIATFTVALDTTADTLDQSYAKHVERVAVARKALQALEKLGLKVDGSTYQAREFRPTLPPTPPGVRPPPQPKAEYHSISQYTLSTEALQNLNEMVTNLAAAEMTVGGIGFRAKNARAALLQARKMAAQDAREQADVYAQAIGIELGDVYRIRDGEAATFSNDGVADLPSRKVGASYPRQSLNILIPDKISYTGTVSVVWKIKPKAQ